jgi:3-oxoacyl-(acyl-carrier-protein) synthase
VNPLKQSPARDKPRFRVLIAGFGLVSPLGGSAWQTFTALLKGRTLADRARQLPPDIDVTDLVRATGAVITAQHSATDPAVDLAERAVREAVTMAGVDPAGLPGFIGTSKGAVHALSAAYEAQIMARGVGGDIGPSAYGFHGRRLKPPQPRDAQLAVALGPHGYLSHHLRQRLHLGPIRHDVAACASSLTALHHAHAFLLHSDAQHVLIMTSEASLLPLFIHSYRRLGVLAPQTPDTYAEHPMDRARQGFVLCEAGAAVLLKRVPIEQEPMPGETELLDTAAACEAYDLIRPSPTMPALRRIAEQLFTGRAIDVIHPHAPGTPDHDPAELNVYADVITQTGQSDLPDFYACKGAIGHGLGAAGLSALVLACLCAKTRQRPPMPWLDDPINAPLNLKPQASSLKPVSTHAVFAAGFAGHTAGAVIRHY